MPSILALISSLLAFFAIMLVFPAFVAFASSDWVALETFFLLALLYGFLSIVMLLAVTSSFKRLIRYEVFFVIISLWVVFAIIAVPPFMLVENSSFSVATFEAVSAAITLGVSFKPLSVSSNAMEFYRSLVAWQGGLLTLLCAVFVLGRYQVGGTPNKHLRLILHSSHAGSSKIVRTFFEVLIPYSALTIIFAALLVLAHIDPVDAFKIALNVISTNGYFPIETGATILNNVGAEIIVIIFMLVGATSILWHRALFNRTWNFSIKKSETSIYFMFISFICLFAIFGKFISSSPEISLPNEILNSIFDVVSIMTTTGITHNKFLGIGLPIALILAIALVGGSSFSTAGGFKIFRFAALLRHSANEIKRLVYPHLIIAKSVAEDAHEREMSKAIWSALFISVLTIMAATLLFSLFNYNLLESLGLAVGSFSSTGNIVSSSLALSNGEIPTNSVLISISIVGLASRIELLVILAAFSKLKW